MPTEPSAEVKFEIGHVLFIDIVSYSKMLITEQSELLQTLKQIARGTEQFRLAKAEGKLLGLPTGDGGALVFRTSPEAPVLCATRRAAEITVARAEKVLAQDQNNGTVTGWGVGALAILGEAERAKEWINRALLIDPDNIHMRYNFTCALARDRKGKETALELLGPVLAKTSMSLLNHAKIDPDLNPLRDDPRFQAMIAAAETRLAAED